MSGTIRSVNRVDRVTAVVRPENLEAIVAQLSFALQTAFYGPFEHPDDGTRMAVSWDAGIELVAPRSLDADDPLREHWTGVKVGVRDLDRTCERLARLGYEPTAQYSLVNGFEPWCDRFRRVDEACFDPALFGGLPVVLCSVEEYADRVPVRANVNRVDHVTAVLHHENLEPVTAAMSFALQTAFYGPFEHPGIASRLSVSWDAGIELITSSSPDRRSASLEALGERWISVIYGVRDLDETIERLALLGHEPTMRFTGLQPFDPWCDRFTRFEEARFDMELFGGLSIVFSTIQERSALEP